MVDNYCLKCKDICSVDNPLVLDWNLVVNKSSECEIKFYLCDDCSRDFWVFMGHYPVHLREEG